MIDRAIQFAKIDSLDQSESYPLGPRVPWWSFTKTALAAAALRLVERDELSLDGPVEHYPFTLRQLLQHTAGVPNYGSLHAYRQAVQRGDKPWDKAELLSRVAAHELDFEPGTGWAYSNVAYLFVRQLIEKAVSSDLEDSLRSLLFDSLGLGSVKLARTSDDLVTTAWGNPSGYDPGWVYHGLLVGTAYDAVRFLASLMSGDVLPRELLEEMITPHPLGDTKLPGRPWETTGYGLGLMIGRMSSAGLSIGHSGGGPGSVCAVYHFRDRVSPCTIGAFGPADHEGVMENEVARLLGTT